MANNDCPKCYGTGWPADLDELARLDMAGLWKHPPRKRGPNKHKRGELKRARLDALAAAMRARSKVQGRRKEAR